MSQNSLSEQFTTKQSQLRFKTPTLHLLIRARYCSTRQKLPRKTRPKLQKEPFKRRREAALTITHLGKFDTKVETIAAIQGKWTILKTETGSTESRSTTSALRFEALCDWTKAYQRPQRKQPIVVIKLLELKLYYIGSSKNPDINKRTVDAWMTKHLGCTFDALTRHEESMYCMNTCHSRRG